MQCIENTSQCKKDFIKNYIEKSDEVYFLEVDVQYPKKLMINQFYQKEWKLKR